MSVTSFAYGPLPRQHNTHSQLHKYPYDLIALCNTSANLSILRYILWCWFLKGVLWPVAIYHTAKIRKSQQTAKITCHDSNKNLYQKLNLIKQHNLCHIPYGQTDNFFVFRIFFRFLLKHLDFVVSIYILTVKSSIRLT